MFDDDTKLILRANVNNLSAAVDRMEAAMEIGDARELVFCTRLINSVISCVGPMAEHFAYKQEREEESRREKEEGLYAVQ